MKRYQEAKRALGSDVLLTAVLADDVDPRAIFEVLWQKIDRFEQRFSRFLATSELTSFNHSAGKRQQVSTEFLDLLAASKSLAEKTSGLYNPFILPALQQAGYKGSWPHPEIVEAAVNYERRNFATWTEIKLGENWAQIPQGTALDFGGIGKGYLLDELAACLHAQRVKHFWLSLGGDILCSGYDLDGAAWQIAVQSAVEVSRNITTVIGDGDLFAVATSGVTKRKGETIDGTWHHLIDPRTGKPASTDILTTTVVTDKAVEADVFAKCLVIVGNGEAVKLANLLGVRNVFVQYKDSGGTMESKKIGDIWG